MPFVCWFVLVVCGRSYPVGGVVLGDGGEAQQGVAVVGDGGVHGAVDLEDLDGGVEAAKVHVAVGLEDDAAGAAGGGLEEVGGEADEALGDEAAIGVAGGVDLLAVNAELPLDVGHEGAGKAKVVDPPQGGGGAAAAGIEGGANTLRVGHNKVWVVVEQKKERVCVCEEKNRGSKKVKKRAGLFWGHLITPLSISSHTLHSLHFSSPRDMFSQALFLLIFSLPFLSASVCTEGTYSWWNQRAGSTWSCRQIPRDHGRDRARPPQGQGAGTG